MTDQTNQTLPALTSGQIVYQRAPDLYAGGTFLTGSIAIVARVEHGRAHLVHYRGSTVTCVWADADQADSQGSTWHPAETIARHDVVDACQAGMHEILTHQQLSEGVRRRWLTKGGTRQADQARRADAVMHALVAANQHNLPLLYLHNGTGGAAHQPGADVVALDQPTRYAILRRWRKHNDAANMRAGIRYLAQDLVDLVASVD